MLKKILLAVAVALPMFASAQSTIKIGVVNTGSIIQGMPETKDAQTKIADTSKKYEDAYGKLIEEYKRLAEEFQGLKEDTPVAIRENKARDLQDKQAKIQHFEQQAQEDLSKQQQELMAPVMQKIQNAVDAVGKEEGFTTISEIQSYLYIGSGVTDITDKVKSRLGLPATAK